MSDPLADREGKLLRRIAALEAARNELMATVEQVVEKLDKAEAELAALNGRRCETCKFWRKAKGGPRGWPSHCVQIDHNVAGDFACNRWAERRTK